MAKSYDLLFENDDFIAVNKPPGMLTIPDRFNALIPSLYSLLNKEYEKIFVVHRLDKETSGLLLFAKNETAHRYLSGLFEQREIEKHYLAIVHGSMPGEKGEITEPIAEHPYLKGQMVVAKKGKISLTKYEVKETFRIYSLVDFQILTGRTHQIRVHAKHTGHPIVCDSVYGKGDPILLSTFKRRYKLSDNEEQERPLLSRLALHSSQLSFKWMNAEVIKIEAPLPKDMRALLQQLKKNN